MSRATNAKGGAGRWRKLAVVAAGVCVAIAFALAGLGMSSAYYTDRDTADNEVGFIELHALVFDAGSGTIDAAVLGGDVLDASRATLRRTVADGAPVGALPKAQRGNASADGGLLFAGWFDAALGEDAAAANADDVARASMTYRARWNVGIVFDAGEGAIDAGSALSGDELADDGATLRRVRGEGAAIGPVPVATRDGYAFSGWASDLADGGDGGEAVGEATVPIANVTYHAHWTRTMATVTFDPAGGEIDARSVRAGETLTDVGTLLRMVPTGDELGTPPVATRRDREYVYELVGWYTTDAASGGERVGASTVVSGNVTYHARWVRQQGSHTVTFNAGDGAFANGDKAITRTRAHNAELGELPDAPTRRRHRFLGWFSESGVQVNERTRITGDVTFRAHWGAQVIFDANGGTFGGAGTRLVFGCALGDTLGNVMGEAPQDPAWGDGSHVFAGWYTDAYGGRKVNVSMRNTVVRSYTFYAHWDVQVSFDPSGGAFSSGDTGLRTASVNSELFGIGVLPTLRTRSGYVLDGWYTEPDGRGTKVCAYSRPTPGATYHAAWRPAGDIHYATATVGGTGTLYLSSHPITAYPAEEGATLGVISAYEGGRTVGAFSGDASQPRTSAGVGWSTMSFTRVVVLDRISPTTCAEWFAKRSGSTVSGSPRRFYSSSVASIEGLANIDMTDVTSMAGMFKNADGLSLTTANLADMAGWNVTSKMTSLAEAFSGTGRLNQVPGAMLDLSGWDVGGVANAYRMFYNAYVDGTLNASTWNLAGVEASGSAGTAYMFYSTSAHYAMRLDLSGATFNAAEGTTFAGGSIKELVVGPGWTAERGELSSDSACYMLEPSAIGTDGMATATTYSGRSYFMQRSIPIQAFARGWADAGVDSVTYRYFASTDAASAAAGVIRESADAHAAAFEALATALPAPADTSLADADAVAAARASYDGLWSREHLLVNNELVSKLIGCECRIKALAGEATAGA